MYFPLAFPIEGDFVQVTVSRKHLYILDVESLAMLYLNGHRKKLRRLL